MAGWTDGDNMTPARRNREWVIGRLSMPFYDVNNSAAVTAEAKPVDGDDVVTSETTHYTVGAALALAIVHSITITNSAATAQQVSVHLIASGGSRTVANTIFDDEVEAGESITLPGPWLLGASATIRSISAAATANQIGLRAEVTELDSLPTGVTPIVDEGDALTVNHAAYYTCPASGVQHADIVNVTLCNTDTAAHIAEVAVIPSGQTATGRYFVFADLLEPGETVVIATPFVLQPSDFLSARADTGALVSLRVSPVQLATT